MSTAFQNKSSKFQMVMKNRGSVSKGVNLSAADDEKMTCKSLLSSNFSKQYK